MVNIILISTARSGRDIELPPSVTHRSVDKTIILIPGDAREVTDEEWAFIQASHADLMPDIRVLQQPTPPTDEPATE